MISKNGILLFLLILCLVLVPQPSRASEGHVDGSITTVNDVMTMKLDKVSLAFAKFEKTKSSKELSKIKELNDDASNSLFDWWGSVTALCCIVKKGEDPKITYKKAIAQYEPILTAYLIKLCDNYTKLAEAHVSLKSKKAAKSLYQMILDSFDPTNYGSCVVRAERGLKSI